MSESRNQTVELGLIDIKVKELTNAIVESKEYKDYIRNLEIIKKDPELYARVCEFRRRNFELQNTEVDENIYDGVMQFQNENSSIRKIDSVNDFLKSELCICRMLRDVNRSIMNEIDLDIEFLQ